MGKVQLQRWNSLLVAGMMMMMVMVSEVEAGGPEVRKVFGDEEGWMGGRVDCGVAQRQGRRPHQEDRVICMPELLLPGPDTARDLSKCQETLKVAVDAKGAPSSLLVKELTIDHRPDRLDERNRIEAAGGFVSTWGGVARVNGQLAISRAIGDATFKKYGVIAEPEFSEWQKLTVEDSYLIITSDGIFERMEPQDVCNLVQDKYEKNIDSSFLKDKASDAKLDCQALADAVVDSAFKSGSLDNLAAVVYPLRSSDFESNTSEHSEILRGFPSSNKGIEDDKDRLLFAGKEEAYCYELIERVPSGVVLPLQTSVGLASTVVSGEIMYNKTEVEGLASTVVAGEIMYNKTEVEGPVDINLPYGHRTGPLGTLEVYHEHLVCLWRPLLSDEDEVCLNPEMFSSYLRLIEAAPLVESNFSEAAGWDKRNGMDPTGFYPYTRIHERYVLTKNIGRGGFGEVWFAVSKNCSNDGNTGRAANSKKVSARSLESHQLKREPIIHPFTNSVIVLTKTGSDPQQEFFVLKRILVEKGNAVYLSGIREKYFGEIFSNARKLVNLRTMGMHKTKPFQEIEDGLNHIARYVESFQVNMEGDLWLVFCNEGLPLSSMLYTADTTVENNEESYGGGHIRVLETSNWWRWLKTTKDGQREMQSLIYQLLLGMKACHDRNITHRDIKPENMMVRATSRCSVAGEVSQLHMEFPCNLSMRIIDFGSAVDTYSLQNLYGAHGPSRTEQTEEYTPPESFLQRNWLKVHGKYATRYDMWSVGVVMLELVLGTPHVFQIAARTRAFLDQHLEGWGSSALNTAYILRALMEMCILYPGKSGHHRPITNLDSFNLASWKCTEENLMQQIKEHDPLGIGLEDVWALRLLRALLQWHPEDRITVEEALKHPYFHSSLQGKDEKT